MAGKNRVAMAGECLRGYKGQMLFLEPLKAIIEKHLASSEKVVIEYLRLMITQGLIKEIPKKGYSKWKVL